MDALLRFYVNQIPCRKREVIYWVSQGLTNDEVAQKLCIESCGVAGHLTEIYGLLGTLEIVQHYTEIKRPVLISLFAVFFHCYPEMIPACR
jgi:DNA-binding CsgD family transcriptional regulator